METHREFRDFLANEFSRSPEWVLENASLFRQEIIVPVLIYCLETGSVPSQLVLAHLAKLRDKRAIAHIIQYMATRPEDGEERKYCSDTLTSLLGKSFFWGRTDPDKWRRWWDTHKPKPTWESQKRLNDLVERIAILRLQAAPQSEGDIQNTIGNPMCSENEDVDKSCSYKHPMNQSTETVPKPQNEIIPQKDQFRGTFDSFSSKHKYKDFLLAASEGSIEQIKSLLEKGVDPNIKAPSGVTALMFAAQEQHITVVKVLLAHHADPNLQGPQGVSALYSASQVGNVPIIRALINAGANVNIQTEKKATPLIIAAMRGKSECVVELVRAGADVDHRDCDGMSALYNAVQEKEENCADILIQAGAYIDARSEKGATPLMIASELGLVTTVKALLGHGADANAKDRDGLGFALFISSQKGYLEIVQDLLKAGADANTQRPNGVTPLIIAASHGHTEVVRRLIESGANLFASTDRGTTALTVSIKGGHSDVVELLKKAGA
ncbi:MAG: ankyrin repeat domain-containing protein [Nitrospira sp.]|nr:ankyrin repeat domain-containing protein [Nitrospira sp.]